MTALSRAATPVRRKTEQPPCILIVGGDCSAGLAIVQDLGAAGYRCTLAGKTDKYPSFASRYAARKLIHPDPLRDRKAWCDWVVKEQAVHKYDLIIPPTEETLVPLHDMRDNATLKDVLAIPAANSVETAFDKESIRQLAVSLQIPCPDNLLIESAEDLAAADFSPWLSNNGAVVLKTTHSKVWRGEKGRGFQAQIFRDEFALRTEVTGLLPYTSVQLQQWVPGHGVGIELLARHGEIVMAFAHERIHEVPLTGGASSYRKSIVPPPELLDDSARLLKALNWHGVAMVEFRRDSESNRHWLMEINGRFWGSLPLAIFAGAPFPRALVELLLNDKVPQRMQPGRTNVFARRIPREVKWFKHMLMQRNNSDPMLRKPRLVPALLQWGRIFLRREIWDGGAIRDPRPIFSTLRMIASREWNLMRDKLQRRKLMKSARTLAKQRIASARPVKNIAVLCFGNICRSPYAAHRLREALPHVGITSAGFIQTENRHSPAFLQDAARQLGVELQNHRSSCVDGDELRRADLILLMDQHNHELLADFDADLVEKSVWLGAVGNGPVEIDDPYDEPSRAAEILQQIDDAVASLVEAVGD